MRGPQLFVATWLAFSAAGCASSLFRRVEREPEVKALDASTDDIVVTENTRIDPASYLRFELGERKTDWWPATLFEVNHRGVLLRASLSGALTEVKITGVSPARRQALAAIQGWPLPTEEDDGVWVRGADLRAWLTLAARTGTPEPREHWRIMVRRSEEGGRPTELYLPGSVIAANHGLPAAWEEFVSWGELNAFRTNRFNTRTPGVLTLVAATAATIGTTGLWVIDFLAAPAGGGTSLLSGASPKRMDSTDYDEDWPLHLPLHADAQPVSDDEAAGAHRIFTPAATRKHVIRPQLSVESGGDLMPPARTLGGGAWLGVRLFDLFELSGGPEAWWPEPLRPSGWVSPGPLFANRPASKAYWLAAGRAQLIFDLDRERRFLVMLGAQLSGSPEGIWRFRFTWGLQVRLVGGLFVSLRPFTPALAIGWPGTVWHYPTTLELGCSF